MSIRKPIIIEMTGIFGAGYLPGLFKPLKALLQENFLWIDADKSKGLIANYHVDNEAVRKRDVQRRERITHLIKQVPNLNPEEWNELIAALRWADELFQESLEAYPSNVVFRRGGKLQNYILLRRTQWQEADMNRLQPKLQVFLEASYSAIKQTFEQNQEVRRIIRESPELFCESPERAMELQEEWLQTVKDFPGLIHIKRQQPGKEEFANEEFSKEIINTIIPLLNLFGLKTTLRRKVFISYSRKDEWFADKLDDALNRKNVGVWIDKREILVGDSIIKRIREGIATSHFICAVISSNSINSKWVQEELDMAMNQQIESGEVKVLPLVLESGLPMPSFLVGKLHIDFSKEDFDKCVEDLMRRLKPKK
ncbi:MAG TPA: toll/interleukin-1 receptor domain-containing protein [Pyrinomonadaceae bacterium]|nr:toll/interleukin-1 receptor domain-containing protein [Pyrinomonadaceae bacterium]